MQPVDPTAHRHDSPTLVLRWAMAVPVVTQWLGAQTIDRFPRGSLRVNARSVQVTVGLLLAALLLGRAAWHPMDGRRPPRADKGTVNIVAKGTYWRLYASPTAMVLAVCRIKGCGHMAASQIGFPARCATDRNCGTARTGAGQ